MLLLLQQRVHVLLLLSRRKHDRLLLSCTSRCLLLRARLDSLGPIRRRRLLVVIIHEMRD